jgi:hypothetical protein
MTTYELTIYDLPVKPPTAADRTPALIGKEIDTIMRRTKQNITVASIAIGYRLIEAKKLEGHGAWLPWLAARGINERTARRTMELAGHHEFLTNTNPDKLDDFMGKSLRQALAIVHEEKVTKQNKPRVRSESSRKGDSSEERPPYPEIMPPDPVHVLHHLAQRWPVANIRQHQLTREQADLLEEDLPTLLPALIELAERHDVTTGLETAAEPVEPKQTAATFDHQLIDWLAAGDPEAMAGRIITGLDRDQAESLINALAAEFRARYEPEPAPSLLLQHKPATRPGARGRARAGHRRGALAD